MAPNEMAYAPVAMATPIESRSTWVRVNRQSSSGGSGVALFDVGCAGRCRRVAAVGARAVAPSGMDVTASSPRGGPGRRGECPARASGRAANRGSGGGATAPGGSVGNRSTRASSQPANSARTASMVAAAARDTVASMRSGTVVELVGRMSGRRPRRRAVRTAAGPGRWIDHGRLCADRPSPPLSRAGKPPSTNNLATSVPAQRRVCRIRAGIRAVGAAVSAGVHGAGSGDALTVTSPTVPSASRPARSSASRRVRRGSEPICRTACASCGPAACTTVRCRRALVSAV